VDSTFFQPPRERERENTDIIYIGIEIHDLSK
jgi:hypothetical protein